MKRILILISLVSLIFTQGKIGGTTYFNYTKSDDESSFNFVRQYFSYSDNISDNLKFKVVFDVVRTDIGTVEYTNDGIKEETDEDTRLVSFLKKAQIDMDHGFATLSFGLIGMNTYGTQEKNWGYRFIEKSAIDKNKFSSTADIGLGVSKSINDLYMNFQIVNGEGYKEEQSDKNFKMALNLTYGERKLTKKDGYNVGLIYTTESTSADPTTMTSIFGGYAGMGLRVGAEYDVIVDDGINEFLMSFSANYSITEKLDLFARYDQVTDDEEINTIAAGVVMNCGNGVSIAPNVRQTKNETNETETEYKVNFQFKF